MKSTLYNLGPMLGVLGVVAWLCWPHVVNYGSSPPYRGGEKLVRIDKKQLEPQIPSASQRNPFKPLSPPQTAAADQRSLSREGTIAVLEPEIDWQKFAQSLTLSGTFSGGGKPCVLINGQVYDEGSQVPTPFAGVFYTVTRVLEDGVELAAGDQQVRLTYVTCDRSSP